MKKGPHEVIWWRTYLVDDWTQLWSDYAKTEDIYLAAMEDIV